MINNMLKNPSNIMHDQLSIINHDHMANTCNFKKLTLDTINKIILWCKEQLSVSKMGTNWGIPKILFILCLEHYENLKF
jgi:hypothetical protein